MSRHVTVSVRDLVGKRRKVFTDGPMACPRCGSRKLACIDSRGGFNNSIRRRRGCTDCSWRFTTFERHEDEETTRHLGTDIGVMLMGLSPEQVRALRVILAILKKD